MKLHLLAIFLGTITDLILSFTVGPLVLYVLGINENSPYLYQGSLGVGLVAVAIGGYVTARKSQSFKLFNTTIFGVIQVMIGIAAAMFVPAPLWFNITSLILIIPAALLGVYAALHV
jgi:hypothetical protein